MKTAKINFEYLRVIGMKIKELGLQNNHIPISKLIEINSKNEKIYFKITDMDTFVQFSINKIEGNSPDNNFKAFIDCDLFCKLLYKITDINELDLIYSENSLTLKTKKAKYVFELALVENIQDWEIEAKENCLKIDINELAFILKIAPSAVATDLRIPLLRNYFISDNIYTTNQIRLCQISKNLLNVDLIMSASLFKGLKIFDKHLYFYQNEDGLVFFNEDMAIKGLNVINDTDITIDKLKELTDKISPHFFTVKRGALISLIERIQLFVKEIDKNEINFEVIDHQLRLYDKHKKADEVLDLITQSEISSSFKVKTAINELLALIKSLESENITIHYGGELPYITLISENCIQVLALIEDN